MINDIKNITWFQSLITLTCFLGGICPGFLIIFLYKPELISSLDSLKLWLFSISLCLPVVLINYGVLGIFADDRVDRTEGLVASLIITALVLYAGVLVGYLFDFSFKEFLIALLVMELIGLIILAGMKKFSKNK
jgi:hypothetical protein